MLESRVHYPQKGEVQDFGFTPVRSILWEILKNVYASMIISTHALCPGNEYNDYVISLILHWVNNFCKHISYNFFYFLVKYILIMYLSQWCMNVTYYVRQFIHYYLPMPRFMNISSNFVECYTSSPWQCIKGKHSKSTEV